MTDASREAFEKFIKDEQIIGSGAILLAESAWQAAIAWANARYGNPHIRTDHPENVVGPSVEAIGLTKREWLMAQFPLGVVHLKSVTKSDEELLHIHARLARLWADAIIKEAARDDA